MRIVVLTARPDLPTNRALHAAARGLGVECEIIDATRTVGCVEAGPLEPPVGGHRALDPTEPVAVIARVGNWRPATMLAVLESYLQAGAVTANPPPSIRRGRDHWLTVLTLVQAGLPVPRTLVCMDPKLGAEAAVERFAMPVVIKVRSSRMGVGVMLCHRKDHLQSLCDSLWRVGDEFILQEFVPGGNRSIRALVVGDQVVAAARFSSAPGEWRSNGAQGGAAEAVSLSVEDRRLAISAAQAMDLDICGVDLLPAAQGSQICEVNPTPGFIRLQSATGVDVAQKMVRYLLTLRRPDPH